MALVRNFIKRPPLREPSILKILYPKINLKPVKRVNVKFDPFSENVKSVRRASYYLHDPIVLSSNPFCSFNIEILTDRSEPSITFKLVNGEDFVFKTANLTHLEILYLYVKHIAPLAPQEDVSNLKSSKTKSKKKKGW